MSPFHWFGPIERCVTQNKYYFDIDEMKLPYGYGILILLLHNELDLQCFPISRFYWMHIRLCGSFF
jgi:hypothetical protein